MISIILPFNSCHSELGLDAYNYLDKTRGCLDLWKTLNPLCFFQGIDFIMYPWLEDELCKYDLPTGRTGFTHALLPLIKTKKVKDFFWNLGYHGTHSEIGFAPEFAVDGSSDYIPQIRYFFVPVGGTYSADRKDIGLIGDSISLKYPDNKIGIVMHEKYFGPIKKAWHLFKIDPSDRQYMDYLIREVETGMREMTVWPVDGEEYVIGSPQYEKSLEVFVNELVKRELDKEFRFIGDNLEVIRNSAISVSEHPKRKLDKWMRFSDAIEEIQLLEKDVEQWSKERFIVYLIAMISDFFSGMRWDIENPATIVRDSSPNAPSTTLGGPVNIQFVAIMAKRALTLLGKGPRNRPFSTLFGKYFDNPEKRLKSDLFLDRIRAFVEEQKL